MNHMDITDMALTFTLLLISILSSEIFCPNPRDDITYYCQTQVHLSTPVNSCAASREDPADKGSVRLSGDSQVKVRWTAR